MAEHPLDEVFPVGEVNFSWDEGVAYVRGVTRAEARRMLWRPGKALEQVWVVARLGGCPEWGDDSRCRGCCGGECEGGPVWRVVPERVPGARRAWRSV